MILTPIYIFDNVTVFTRHGWGEGDNDKIERTIFFNKYHSIGTGGSGLSISQIYHNFSSSGPKIYIPKNTKYIEIDMLNKDGVNISGGENKLFKNLNFIVQLNDKKMNTMINFKKISYNKYAIENPPSGMFYTNFYSMGYLKSSHSINFITDIVISIK